MNNRVKNIVKMMAVLMGLFVCGSVLAQNGNVREETARQVGLNFLKLKDGNPRSDLQLTRVDAVQYPNLYVYNTSENGFIVVASDNRMEPILAYSDEGTFDKDNVAPGANFWFEMYEYAIDSIVRNNVRDVDDKITQNWEDLINGVMPEKTRDLIFPQFCEPLIRTQWGQGSTVNWANNYNRFCPWYEKNGQTYRAVTGCVATALGQLINYLGKQPDVQAMNYAFTHLVHEDYPNEFTSLHLTSLFGEEVNSVVYPGCGNLNSIRKYYYWGDWNINDQEERAAQIMFDCGLAVDMEYGVESSASTLQPSCPNSSSAESALKNYFGYHKAYGLYKKDFTNNQWQDTLKKYISHSLPLMYRGTNSEGSHSFICDGYDAWNCFHFNYGYEGEDDGYYWVCWQTLYYNPQILFNEDQACLIAYPIMQYDVTNINDVIEFHESKTTYWNNSTIAVEYNENPSIEEDSQAHTYTIKYNHPGYYRLNPIVEDDKLLNYSVRVVGIDTIRKAETICRREGFKQSYEHEGNNVNVSLNRDETDFSGTQQFYNDINNNVTGELTAILEVSLTTSGAISEHTLPPITVSRCDLPNHGNYYYWDIGGELIRCEYSGIYEKVFERNGECDSVVYLNLTIEEPENRFFTDTLLCYNSCPFNFHGIEIDLQSDTIGRITTYNVCENDVLYTLELGLIDTIRKPVDIDICTDEAPYTWHGHTLPWVAPGFYDTTFMASSGCECDTVYYIYLNIRDCCEPPLDCLENNINKSNRSTPSNIENIYYGLKHYFDYRSAMNKFLVNVLRGVTWPSIEDRNTFWNLFQSLLDANTGMMTEQAMQQLIITNPYSYVSEDYITNLVERYNRSVMYWNEGQYSVWYLPQGYNPDSFIEYDTAAMNKAYEAYDYAIAHGFNDVKAMYDNAYELLAAEVDNIQSSVCAKVTVQFNQKMTMTREAFNGTLQIFNGHESIPMQDIMVDFRIEDQQGNDCTNLFQINTLSLDQITSISGNGSLAAQTNGTALVQFIPTKNAAPTQPVVYSFGGSFSFIDPFTGEGLTYPLYPVDITVNPSPDLYVDYFMQRDILGDDALTEDVVEPTVPAELGVIIHNQGAGEAKNVTLETAEPQIIDNDRGLAIDFAMYGASFNGSPRQLGLMEIPFGNIGSGQTAVGEWLFTSSLLGHFVSYEAHVIHNSSYGNSDLSLVSHLDIHELIHPIYAYGNLDDGINDFLVNDNPDAYDTPDSIYFSHGGRTSVGVVDDISFDHLVSPSDTIVTLTVEPSRVGWNYGVTDDPGMNQYNIVSCIRNNDNQVIPLNNVWLTFVTIPDGGDPVYENKLHIVDTIPVQQTTTYTLVLSKKPSNLRIFHGNEDEYWSNAANWEGSIIPQADDEVLINGICELDEDAEVFSLTVAENKALTIPDGRILTVSGTLTNSDVSGLVIEDGGQLMHGNFGAQGTVQKNILPYTNDNNGWYLIASPLAGFTSPASVVNMLSNEYDLYYFDQSHELEWINYEGDDGNYDLVPGKGYLYANSEDIVLEFPGELRSGVSTLTVPLYYEEGAEFLGFNLVGNPFVYNVSTYATNNVAEGCFRMNETKDDLIVSEISEDNPLHPAEGFFVKATDDGAYITFNPQMTNMPPKGSIRVELSENNLLIDRLIVKTHEGHSLEKFNLNETRSKVYAQGKHRECAIVPCSGNEQPINFKAAKNGQYTINVNSDGLEFNYLHLIDNLTGNDVDLLVEPSYTFEAKTSDYASRFKLVFSVCGDADNDAPFAFISNGNIVIIGAEAGSVLQIVDVMGRVLVSRGGHIQSIPTSGMAKGVYILRFVNGNNVKTQKIVVE